MSDLNEAFAKALGLPRNTVRAVLVLEAGKAPLVHVEQVLIVTRDNADALESIPFLVRLEHAA